MAPKSTWASQKFEVTPLKDEDWQLILQTFPCGIKVSGQRQVLTEIRNRSNNPLSIDFFWQRRISFDTTLNSINRKFRALKLPYKIANTDRGSRLVQIWKVTGVTTNEELPCL